MRKGATRQDKSGGGIQLRPDTRSVFVHVYPSHETLQTPAQERKTNAHFILHGVRFVTRRVGDGDVQIAVVARIGRAGQATCDFVAFGHGERCRSVKHRLSEGEDTPIGNDK